MVKGRGLAQQWTEMHDRQVAPIFYMDDWLECTQSSLHLVGRVVGKACRDAIESALSHMAGEAVLTIDVKGVETLDYPAADECFVKLVRRVISGDYGTCAVVLTGTTPSHERVLTVAMDRAKQAILVQRKMGPEIVGWLAPYLRMVFDAVVHNAPMTARDLADATDISISLASTTLLTLYRRRFVQRRDRRLPGGGIEYAYSPVQGLCVES